MQLGVALGTVSGYLVTSLSLYLFSNVLIILNQWTYPYYLQIILLIPCLISYSLSDEKLLSTQEETEENIIEKQSLTDILKQNLNILTNPLFVYTILSLSSLFFVVTGIQFWITDYLRMVLLMPHELVFKAFLIISLSAPLSGVYLGGLMLHYYGGYDGNNAMRIVSIEALCASISGFFIPYLNNGWVVLIFLWFLLFFGGSAVPAIMGIMISSIPKEQRSSGNSLSHLFQELLGYLPAPVLYGYVQSLTGGQTSRWGMILLAFWGFFGFVFIVIGMYSKRKSDIQFDTSFNQSEEQDKVAIDLPKTKIDINNKKDFSYIRMQTSIQSGKSINLAEKSPRESNDSKKTPLLYEMESMRIRNAFRRQTSFQQTITNVSCLLGRGSLDADTFQQKEEFLRQKSKQQKEIELQVSGQLYLMSEGRYVQQQ